MTVKCLAAHEKQAILVRFVNGQSIACLSYEYRRSRRTIIRVIEEGGLDPNIRRRVKPQPEQRPLVLPTAQPISTKSSWWTRTKQFLNRPVRIPEMF